MCKPEFGHALSAEIEAIKNMSGAPGSVQWKHLSRRNLPKYKAVIDCFFEHNKEQRIDFCVLALDTEKFDHKRYNSGSHEDGFNKFMFQYFFRWQRLWKRASTFRCFPDQRESSQSLDELQEILNATAAKRYSKASALYFKRHFLEVKHSSTRKEPLLQISDILIGACGAAWNQKLTNPDSPKTLLAEHIRKRACLPTLSAPTHSPDWNFSIWEFDLDGSRGP